MTAVRLPRARARSLLPSLQHRSHCSFLICRSLRLVSLPLQGFATLSNRGIHHVPLTAGTAGALDACRVLNVLGVCVCVRAVGRASALRRAMGNDVANSKPGISVTV